MADADAAVAGEDPAAKAEAAADAAPSPMISRIQKVLEPMPRLRAKVVHGFGRGSKVLGFPTANMEIKWEQEASPEALAPHEREVLEFASTCETGIYYAWAQVVNGTDRGVHKAAMSVGWNPTFADMKAKTVEPWILHDFPEDFYDCELRLVVCGYVRPELKFDKFDDLITAIREDGDFCKEALDAPSCAEVKTDAHFLPLE
eukprot:CAMPEP_0195098950 /NCGR_PEP_ID=MMETSP0448-20130528/57975_1 /TAXON_ID=66468 /ORGANISM="Heterocapsa triquestra, Strain CCMP 448" /LENGTH=201 /DNA_ID=CAMNT_0040133739 /DNA_START=30 /DNA_END=635 /DNA_ORIENTATION=+